MSDTYTNFKSYVPNAPPVTATRLPGSMTYELWGGTQNAKAGDYLLDNGADVYTCDAEVFATTYTPTGEPNRYKKTAGVEAVVAEFDGSVPTLEGRSKYVAGDYIVRNPGGDLYAVSKATFEKRYILAA